MFLKKLFNKAIEKQVDAKVKKFTESIPLFNGVDQDDWMYRAITSNENRDLNIVNQDRMIDISYYLYKQNLTAQRIINITRDFVIGTGIEYTAEDKNVKEIFDDFWNDPINQWDLKQGNKVSELAIFGEQIYPVFVNNVNGKVRIGYIDPKLVSKVQYDINNCEIPRKIVVRGQKEAAQEKVLSIIQYDDKPKSKTFEKLVGECFFFAINKVSNATRGTSDLFALADWLDGYDKFLFNRLDRQGLMNAFVWDVTLNNMSPPEIQAWLQDPRNGPPKPGSIRAHNDKVKWEAVSPNMRSNDASHEGRMIKNHMLSGAGFPEHWFAEGGNTNKATASEMGEPTIKQLKARQKYVKYIIEYIFKFVIDQAKIYNNLAESANETFQVIMPEISAKDVKAIAGAMKDVTTSVGMANQMGLLSKETGAKIFATTANQLGVDIDPDEESKKIADERANEENQDYLEDEKKRVNENKKPQLNVLKTKGKSKDE